MFIGVYLEGSSAADKRPACTNFFGAGSSGLDVWNQSVNIVALDGQQCNFKKKLNIPVPGFNLYNAVKVPVCYSPRLKAKMGICWAPWESAGFSA
jgi:hypothetical protein